MKRTARLPSAFGPEIPLVEGVFSALGALTSRQEEQLSRTFQTCFAHSRSFRAVAARVLSQHCSLPFKLDPEAGWSCDVEVPTTDGKGRIDIRLRPVGDLGARKTICIESKVRAPDKREQLLRYVGMGTVILLTKELPRVGDRWMNENCIRHLRWQDLHDALSNPNGIKGKDKFLIDEFCRYLEDMGMAWRSKVTKKDIEEISRVFRVIGSDKVRGIQPRRALEAASRWLNLLSEVAVRLRQENGNLAAARQWGPGYYTWRDEEGRKNQSLALSFMPSRKRIPEFAVVLYICSDEAPQVGVIYNDRDPEFEEYSPLSIPSLQRNGYIDVDVLTNKVLKLAKKWKVVLK